MLAKEPGACKCVWKECPHQVIGSAVPGNVSIRFGLAAALSLALLLGIVIVGGAKPRNCNVDDRFIKRRLT